MKLFLNGGGCGSQTALAYQEINKVIDHSKPVLYVPLAMDESDHPYDDCYKWIKKEISSIELPNIKMVRTFAELEKENFSDYSMIYIGGGNTYKLLKGIKETNVYNKIKEYLNNDGIIYGSSAGSVIFGKSIDPIEIMDKNDCHLRDTSGFDLLNGLSLFVHYTNYRSKLSKKENESLTKKYTDFLIDYTKKRETIIAYPEENTLFFDGEKIKIIGNLPSYIFEKSKKKEYKE